VLIGRLFGGCIIGPSPAQSGQPGVFVRTTEQLRMGRNISCFSGRTVSLVPHAGLQVTLELCSCGREDGPVCRGWIEARGGLQPARPHSHPLWDIVSPCVRQPSKPPDVTSSEMSLFKRLALGQPQDGGYCIPRRRSVPTAWRNIVAQVFGATITWPVRSRAGCCLGTCSSHPRRLRAESCPQCGFGFHAVESRAKNQGLREKGDERSLTG
jgi:hypothetical protein